MRKSTSLRGRARDGPAEQCRFPTRCHPEGCGAQAHIGREGQRGEAVFNLAVECGEALERVTRPVWLDAENIAIGCGDAEILMLEVGKRATHKKRSREQYD